MKLLFLAGFLVSFGRFILTWFLWRRRKHQVTISRSDWEAAQYLLHHFRDRSKVDELLDLITEHQSTRKT